MTVLRSSGSPTPGHKRLKETPAQIPPGTRIDQFRVTRFIGQGGMGQVYLARDTTLGRRVALKLVRAHRGSTLMLLREAQSIARFSHPNIIAIYACGRYAGGLYLALEYLSGQTLRQRLKEPDFVLQDRLRIVRDVALAVSEAHRHEILHLDLKPDNVFLTREGTTKVLDFGLSSTMAAEPTADEIAATPAADADQSFPSARGTPAYMAPEQWSRARRTAATDVWALGVILYELIEGSSPWSTSRSHLSDLAAEICGDVELHFSREPPAPDALRALVADCLVRDPDQRVPLPDLIERLEGAIVGRRTSVGEGQSPFRGLLPFTAEQADLFFGRDREIAEAAERLRNTPVLTIVGASGAGKSSLVQAGVAPRLAENGGWTIIVVRPGSEPFRTLAARLLDRPQTGTWSTSGRNRASQDQIKSMADELRRRPDRLALVLEQMAEQGQVLLIVDQLEELYTMVSDSATQRAFVRAVFLAADTPEEPVRVLVTVRDDFLSRVAEAEPEVRQVFRQVMLLRMPERAAMLIVLTRPVESTGYAFEDPDMVASMVADAGGQIAGLPLLQFAAQVLWERRDRSRKLLTREAHDAMGGVLGALAAHADGVLAKLTEAEVGLARKILLKMVTPDDTRRVVTRAQVLDGLPSEAVGVLNSLIDARLLSTTRLQTEGATESALELAHESLIVTWRRLKSWVDSNREELRFLAEAEQAALLWEQRGRRSDEVWTAAALLEADRTLARISGPVPARVSAFLKAGREGQRRRMLKRRGAVGFAFMLLLAALAVMTVQRQHAREEGRRAEQKRAEAEREGAAAALARGNVFDARAKLRTSIQTQDSVAARALWWQLSEESLVWKRTLPISIRQLDVHPTTGTIVTRGASAWQYIFDPVDGSKKLFKYGLSSALAFSSDGRWVAYAGRKGPIELWDYGASKRIHRLEAHRRPPLSLQFSSDDRTLYSSDYRGRFMAWDVETGQVRRELQASGASIRASAIGPEERLGATVGGGQIRLWDLQEGKPTASWPTGHDLTKVEFHPNGDLIATVGRDQAVNLWSVKTQKKVRRIPTTSAQLEVRFSKDGRYLASAGSDGTIFLFDPKTGEEVSRFVGHDGIVRSLVFTPDGEHLMSAGEDRTVRRWSLKVMTPQPPLAPHNEFIAAIRFSPDGRWAATAGGDETVRVWDVATGQVVRVLGQREGPVNSLDFSSDGQRLVWGSESIRMVSLQSSSPSTLIRGRGSDTVRSLHFGRSDDTLVATLGKRVVVYDVENLRVVRQWTAHEAEIRRATLSFDGRTLATGSLDRTVRLWDVETGERTMELPHPYIPYGLKFDETGRLLASATIDGYLYAWRLDGPKPVMRKLGRHGHLLFHMDLSSDGRYLLTSGQAPESRLWDMAQGETIRTYPGPRGEVLSTALGPGATFVASGSMDHTFRLYDRASGRPVWRAPAWLTTVPAVLMNGAWLRPDGTELAFETKPAWISAIESRGRWAVDGPGGDKGCLASDQDTLEIWDLHKDEKIHEVALGEIKRLAVSPRGCLIQVGDRALWWAFSGSNLQTLATAGVQTIETRRDRLLVALEREVHIFDDGGVLRERRSIPAGVSAVSMSEDNLLLGFDSGQLAYVPLESRTSTATELRTFMTSAVTRLLPGPANTLIAGGQGGEVGLWSLQTGERLRKERLHGAVVHLVWRAHHMYAVTELGWRVDWDLHHLEEPYCTLLKEVWESVPVVWKDGRPKVAPPSPDHGCRSAP